MTYFIGVDVGTGSARAGIFDDAGQLISTETSSIDTWRPREGFAQQSSQQIWGAICTCVRAVVQTASIDPAQVGGIGFDATCSLVLVSEQSDPVTVCPDGTPEQDIILWADHRAIEIAAEIDETGHEMLNISGGKISPEMQIPKMGWLKRHLPASWEKTAHFFDLPDWLTWRATGVSTRSQCSVVCKWTYRGSGEGWDESFFNLVGLGDLVDEGFHRIGTQVALPGELVGELNETSAEELGLTTATKVAVSMIDAHAGALGTLGIGQNATRLALIAGTSACHITVSEGPAYVEGVWGPYRGVVYPDLWANEAGQSMAGAAIDTVLTRHSAWAGLREKAKQSGVSPYQLLEDRLAEIDTSNSTTELTLTRHIVPDFNGNRSPLADPKRLGVTSGQVANPDEYDLALDYLAAVQALSYGTRQILERLASKGVKPTEIIVSGGLAKNRLYCQTHADVTGCTVVIPEQSEPVLLGSAMLAATAARAFPSLQAASNRMCGAGEKLTPNIAHHDFHERKYACFLSLQSNFQELEKLMQGEPNNERH